VTAVGADRVADIEILLDEGSRALTENGDLRTGRQRFENAYHLAEQAGDVRSMALAALGLGGMWVHEHRTVAGAVELEVRLRHVLSLLDPVSSLALRIRARLAGEIDYRRGDHTAVLAVLDEARKMGDPVALVEALGIAHHCLLGPDHGGLRQELSEELIAESFQTGRRGDLLMGLLWQTVDLVCEGNPRAGRLLDELRNHLAEGQHLAVDYVVSAMDVMLAIRAGRFAEAETLSTVCRAKGAATGDIHTSGWHAGQMLAIRWYQGRFVELLPLLDELVHSSEMSTVDTSSLAALATAAAMAGDRRTAASSLATLHGRDLADLPRSSGWLATMNGIVEAAHLLGDTTLSAQAYDMLRPFAHLPMVGSLAIACFGSSHHALGVAALTMGKLDVSVVHLRAAVQQNLALGHWPAVVFSRQRLAEALSRRARPEDVTEARIERDTATGEAGPLGVGIVVAEPPRKPVTCTRVGRNWRIDVAERTAVVKHGIGMFHLATLLANPRQEIRAVDLAAGLAALTSAAVPLQQELDRTALPEYGARLRKLNVDPGSTPDEGERARVAVGKAIRRAIQGVTEADTVIGDHLRRTVRTGTWCSYWPI
jgi:hypothetical protein